MQNYKLSLERDFIIASSGGHSVRSLAKQNLDLLYHSWLTKDPFVVYDLKNIHYCLSISLSNRDGSERIRKRIKSLSIAVSTDLFNWHKVVVSADANLASHNAGVCSSFRYLRVQLTGTQVLHFRSIDLFCTRLSAPPATNLPVSCSRYGYFNNGIYWVTHDAGFFSICSTVLLELVRFPCPPKYINASHSFLHFKDDKSSNIWPLLFSDPIPVNLEPSFDFLSSKNSNKILHPSDYARIPFSVLNPYLNAYFCPSKDVKSTRSIIQKKYDICLDKTIVIVYRGTDKYIESPVADSRLILDRAKAILKLNPGFRVLVQTDQAQIRSFFCGALGNAAFYLDEMPVTEGEAVIHKTLARNRLNFSQTLLSVVLIASDCRHVLLTSSNVSNWVVFFRGSDQGIELF